MLQLFGMFGLGLVSSLYGAYKVKTGYITEPQDIKALWCLGAYSVIMIGLMVLRFVI